jgi:hypothetical protein
MYARGVSPRAAQVRCHQRNIDWQGETVKPSKFSGIEPEKKCCRSKPRCKRCPVVVRAVRKAEYNGICGKKLRKVDQRVRGGTGGNRLPADRAAGRGVSTQRRVAALGSSGFPYL